LDAIKTLFKIYKWYKNVDSNIQYILPFNSPL
jgi:hypothetical protein